MEHSDANASICLCRVQLVTQTANSDHDFLRLLIEVRQFFKERKVNFKKVWW